MNDSNLSRIPLQVSQHCVIASVQVDLNAQVLRRFRTDLLERLHTSGATGVILDVSGVEIMDRQDFNALRQTMSMAALMGAQTVISGLRAGVVAALIELDTDTSGINAALNLDDAFRLMAELRSVAPTPTLEEKTDAPEENVDQNS